jgi:hypothetical protein
VVLARSGITESRIKTVSVPHPSEPVDLTWLCRLRSENVHAAPSAEYIAPITEGLNALLKHAVTTKNYLFLNDLLSPTQFLVHKMRADVMVAILRTVVPVREYLSRFNSARAAVANELSKRGMDAQRVLRGL